MPALYGCCFDVSDIAISVRPWKAPSNAITAGRPVAWRAILTAFSTASAPELKNAALFGPEIGLRATIRSASSTYASYGTIVKSVCRKRSTWACSACGDGGVRVADVQAADAARPVEERVAVDVGDDTAVAVVDDERREERLGVGDHALLARDDRARLRARKLRAQIDRPWHCSPSPVVRNPKRGLAGAGRRSLAQK